MNIQVATLYPFDGSDLLPISKPEAIFAATHGLVCVPRRCCCMRRGQKLMGAELIEPYVSLQSYLLRRWPRHIFPPIEIRFDLISEKLSCTCVAQYGPWALANSPCLTRSISAIPVASPAMPIEIPNGFSNKTSHACMRLTFSILGLFPLPGKKTSGVMLCAL